MEINPHPCGLFHEHASGNPGLANHKTCTIHRSALFVQVVVWRLCLGSALKPQKKGSPNLGRAKLNELLSVGLLFECTLNVLSFHSLGFTDFHPT